MKTVQYKFLIIIIIIIIIIITIRASQKYNWQAKYQGLTFICYFFQVQRVWSVFLRKKTGEYLTPRLKATRKLTFFLYPVNS